jgi:CheY-like chemotaxis protein
MFIMYGDDEQLDRDTVSAALTARGYKVQSLDTSQTDEMTVRLKQICAEQGPPDVFIVDGHNVLRDKAGNKLYDMTPLGMVSWLRQNGISTQSKFILYSNDDEMVRQAQTNRNLNFFEAVPKAGANGGLLALLKAVERAAQS